MSVDGPGQLLAAVFFGTTYLVVAPTLIWTAVMIFTIPRELHERYARPPHFNETETILYSRFPLSFMKFAAIARAIVLPRSMAARKMEDIRNYTPGWYRWLVTAWVYTVLLGFMVAMVCTALLLAVVE